jgi:iduronate 2-sulfatase
VELVDVMPTLCAAAKVGIPEGVEGKNLLSILCKPEAKIRDFALTQYRRNSSNMGYSIRTDEWRYTEWIHPGTGIINEQELYRIEHTGLMETRNVENDYPEEVQRLSKMLHDYLDTAIKYEGDIIP